MVVRTYEEECSYLERLSPHCWKIKKGFQPNMNVEGIFYVNDKLEKLMFDELRNACRPGMVGGFLPGESFYIFSQAKSCQVLESPQICLGGTLGPCRRFQHQCVNVW